METRGSGSSSFVVVQDNDNDIDNEGQQHARRGVTGTSPVIETHIKADRNVNSSDKFSASKGRTSHQLRQSVEENRKRNLANVSHNILSPSQPKAFSEQKGVTRPPSHPGPKANNLGAKNSNLLPPKPDPHAIKRTNSYVNKSQHGPATLN